LLCVLETNILWYALKALEVEDEGREILPVVLLPLPY
jgi:hypothetical protein